MSRAFTEYPFDATDFTVDISGTKKPCGSKFLNLNNCSQLFLPPALTGVLNSYAHPSSAPWVTNLSQMFRQLRDRQLYQRILSQTFFPPRAVVTKSMALDGYSTKACSIRGTLYPYTITECNTYSCRLYCVQCQSIMHSIAECNAYRLIQCQAIVHTIVNVAIRVQNTPGEAMGMGPMGCAAQTWPGTQSMTRRNS